jgi:hypothetical protein
MQNLCLIDQLHVLARLKAVVLVKLIIRLMKGVLECHQAVPLVEKKEDWVACS